MTSNNNLFWKFCLWLFCLFLYKLPFVIFQGISNSNSILAVEGAIGNVIEENDFVMVRTHESGAFVGVKQYIDLGGVKSGKSLPENNDENIGQAEKLSSKSKSGNDDDSILTNKRVYYAFKGIAYAKPPVGPLRWKDPEILDVKDSGPKSSTKYQSICSQWNSVKQQVVGSQDCLYLNIFTPRLFFSPKSEPSNTGSNHSKYDDDPRETKRHLPVLLYIHDGDFLVGSGNLSPETEESFMKQDIILVTLNYRLGAFGFLSCSCSNLPGNYGLLDQISVLKWLHKNIHRFGGNSNRITIFGNTLFLQLTPLSSGLFHSVILMQSTSTLSPSTFISSSSSSSKSSSILNPNPADYFLQFTNAANCSTSQALLNSASTYNSSSPVLEDIVHDCLKNVPIDQLITIQQGFYKFWRYPKVLTPTIDEGLREFGDVLPTSVLQKIQNLGLVTEHEKPLEEQEEETIDKSLAGQTPMLMGVNEISEGFQLFYEFYKDLASTIQTVSSPYKLEEVIKSKLKNSLKFIIGTKLVKHCKVFDGIWDYYFNGIQFNSEEDINSTELLSSFKLFWPQLLQLFGDVTVYTPYWELLQNLRQQQESSLKIFNYVFDPDISLDFTNYVQQQISENELEKDDEDVIQRNPWEEEFYLFLKEKKKNETLMNMAEADEFSKSNKVLSEILINIWVSFAAYENPKNAVNKYKNWTRWTKFGYNYNRLNQIGYYHIKQNVSQMKDNFKKKEAQFWLETIPQLYQLSNTLQELEDWPTLFWIFISFTCILFLIIVTIVGYMFWTRYS